MSEQRKFVTRNEFDKFTSDELIFAYDKFDNTNHEARPIAYALFMKLFVMYRLDKFAHSTSSLFFTRYEMSKLLNCQPNTFAQAWKFLHNNNIIEVLHVPQSQYTQMQVRFGKAITNHIKSFREAYADKVHITSILDEINETNLYLTHNNLGEPIENLDLPDIFTTEDIELIEKLGDNWLKYVKMRKTHEKTKNANQSVEVYKDILTKLKAVKLEDAIEALNRAYAGAWLTVFTEKEITGEHTNTIPITKELTDKRFRKNKLIK